MKKKNIYIFYCSYGNGHKSAAEAIYDAIDKEKNNVKIYDAMKYVDKRFDAFLRNSWDLIRKHSPLMVKSLYYPTNNNGLVSSVVRKHSEMYHKRIFKLFEENMPDEIICTHFMPSFMLSKLIETNKIDARLSVVITDYIVHSYWLKNNEDVNYFFVASEDVKKEIMTADIPEEKIATTGIPIRKGFYEETSDSELEDIRKEFNIPKDKKVIMFFAKQEKGILKVDGMKVLEKLAKELEDYHFICLTENKEATYRQVENIFLENNNPNKSLIMFTDKIPELMKISDGIFSKAGGLTTSEALAMGLPMFIVNPTPGQEDGNSDFIIKHNAGVLMTKENLDEVVSELKNNPDYLKNLSENAQKIGKVNAAKDLLEVLDIS